MPEPREMDPEYRKLIDRYKNSQEEGADLFATMLEQMHAIRASQEVMNWTIANLVEQDHSFFGFSMELKELELPQIVEQHYEMRRSQKVQHYINSAVLALLTIFGIVWVWNYFGGGK